MTKRVSRRKRTSSRSTAVRRAQPKSAEATPVSSEQLGDMYQYVVDDLRRIGLIAVVLIAGLVALSFFLQ